MLLLLPLCIVLRRKYCHVQLSPHLQLFPPPTESDRTICSNSSRGTCTNHHPSPSPQPCFHSPSSLSPHSVTSFSRSCTISCLARTSSCWVTWSLARAIASSSFRASISLTEMLSLITFSWLARRSSSSRCDRSLACSRAGRKISHKPARLVYMLG
jgi:hypothetical protein